MIAGDETTEREAVRQIQYEGTSRGFAGEDNRDGAFRASLGL